MDSLEVSARTNLLSSMVEQIVLSQKHDFSDSKIVPSAKGVYLTYDKSKGLIYVGQSRQAETKTVSCSCHRNALLQ